MMKKRDKRMLSPKHETKLRLVVVMLIIALTTTNRVK